MKKKANRDFSRMVLKSECEYNQNKGFRVSNI
jgi:hypothetical protein